MSPTIPALLVILYIAPLPLLAHQCSNICTCRIIESSCFLHVFELELDDFVFNFILFWYMHGQVSYSSACLSDALQQLPEHFCMLPSKEYLIAGIAGLITYFQWKKVLVINQEYSTFAFVSAALS